MISTIMQFTYITDTIVSTIFCQDGIKFYTEHRKPVHTTLNFKFLYDKIVYIETK